MAKSARKHNAPWTPADLKKMRQLAKDKLSARLPETQTTQAPICRLALNKITYLGMPESYQVI